MNSSMMIHDVVDVQSTDSVIQVEDRTVGVTEFVITTKDGSKMTINLFDAEVDDAES
jgi:hypothetical protein